MIVTTDIYAVSSNENFIVPLDKNKEFSLDKMIKEADSNGGFYITGDTLGYGCQSQISLSFSGDRVNNPVCAGQDGEAFTVVMDKKTVDELINSLTVLSKHFGE